MKYIVMECHKSYAVVLNEQGKFIKVANLGYEVGDRVEKVVPMQEKKEGKILKFVLPAAAAACLCLIVAVWQFLYMPFGTVKIEINPQVLVTSNRVDKVIKLEGINEDGKELIEDYQYKGKDFSLVTEELTDKAETMGYLSSGGDVTITVESTHEDWRIHAEEVLMGHLYVNEGKDFLFIVDGVVLTDHISEEIMDKFENELKDFLGDKEDLTPIEKAPGAAQQKVNEDEKVNEEEKISEEEKVVEEPSTQTGDAVGTADPDNYVEVDDKDYDDDDDDYDEDDDDYDDDDDDEEDDD